MQREIKFRGKRVDTGNKEICELCENYITDAECDSQDTCKLNEVVKQNEALNDEHEYCGEYGTDDCQFAYRIDKLQQECDFWEREAKKNCFKLGEQRIKLQQMECEMCKLEDTDKCRQC